MSEVFLGQMVGSKLDKCEWVWEEILRWLNPRWWNSSWQNSRWLPSSSWFRMNERSFFVQNGWIQDGRNQDGYHHQVESEWMSEVFCRQMVGSKLDKCEWVWEEILRWLNPRWWNSSWQNSRWLPSSSWFRMNERSFFGAKWLNPRW